MNFNIIYTRIKFSSLCSQFTNILLYLTLACLIVKSKLRFDLDFFAK